MLAKFAEREQEQEGESDAHSLKQDFDVLSLLEQRRPDPLRLWRPNAVMRLTALHRALMSRQTAPALRAPASPAEAGAIHDSMIATWLAVQSALVPIIGQGGFASLYQRCLYLALPAHPWLSQAMGSGDGALRFEPLGQALSQQRPEQAAEAQEFLLRTLLSVLSNLIGASLVHQLLGSIVTVSPTIAPEHPRP